MRLAYLLLAVSVCATAQQPSLVQYLGLAPAQVTGVTKLNADLQTYLQGKYDRRSAVQNELNAEYVKQSPDPRGLGERYVELDSIDHEVAAARADVQARVALLLTQAQRQAVQQISASLVQQSLVRDAGCAYLTDSAPSGFGNSFASFLLGVVALVAPAGATACPGEFPVSIRNYLMLTDSQVSAILADQAAYQSFKLQKQNRIADVQAEIDTETAKVTPDAMALGTRYVELAIITQQLTQADQAGRKAARAVLSAGQDSQFQALLNLSSLGQYALLAESCRFLSVPPGSGQADFTGSGCLLN